MNKVKKPDFAKLLEEASKHHVNVTDQDAERLFFDLAGISDLPEYNETYVHLRGIDDAEKKRLRDGNFTVPQKTLMPKRLKTRFLEIVADDPLAFNGYDFTREKQVVCYSEKKTFKCFCGTTITFSKEYVDNKGITQSEQLDEVYCSNPDCLTPPIDKRYSQRHWRYIGE